MIYVSSGFLSPWKPIVGKFYLWYFKLCSWKVFLDLNVFSQRLQGIHTPSKWFDSMCFLMSFLWPSFPHTLQVCPFRCGLSGWKIPPFSIMELTWSSNSIKYPERWFGAATTLSVLWKAPFSNSLYMSNHLPYGGLWICRTSKAIYRHSKCREYTYILEFCHILSLPCPGIR